MKLLIVDDEFPIVQGMLKMLDWKKYGIDQVTAAYSVEHAMDLLKKGDTDIIITDIRMQDGTGLDLLSWMNGQFSACEKIILTSYPSFEYAQNAISLGVSGYLLKPVAPDKLERELQKVIAKRQRQGVEAEKKEGSSDKEKEENCVALVDQYVKEHLDEEITRNDICEKLNISPNYLSRIFRAKTGVTLVDYIKRVRILEAQNMLDYTKLPITLIAQKTGYQTLSYFSSVFKKATGMTPFEYRKRSVKTQDSGKQETVV